MNSFPSVIIIVLLSLLIIFVFLFVFISKFSFNNAYKYPFTFRAYLPSELYYQNNNKNVYAIRILFFMIFSLMIVPIGLFLASFKSGPNLIYGILGSIVLIISLVFSLLFFVIRGDDMKKLITFFTVSFASLVLASSMFGFINFSNVFHHYGYKVIGGFAFALVCIQLVLMFNPKLRKQIEMEKIDNGDGTISYVRPKTLPLAYTMWINFLLQILLVILIDINLLLTSYGL